MEIRIRIVDTIQGVITGLKTPHITEYYFPNSEERCFTLFPTDKAEARIFEDFDEAWEVLKTVRVFGVTNCKAYLEHPMGRIYAMKDMGRW